MSHERRGRVFVLSIMGLLLVSTASVVGIVHGRWRRSLSRHVSARDRSVEIYGGHGLYRHDSVAKAVAFRGFDWSNLVVCLPLSVVGGIAVPARLG